MACDSFDAGRLNYLFRKHVGSGPVSARKLRAVIGRELTAIREGKIKASDGLRRELRGEYITAQKLLTKCVGTALEGYQTTPRDLYVRSGASILTDGGRARTKIKLKWRDLRSRVSITRTGGVGDKAFEACVRIGGGLPGRIPTGGKTHSSFAEACMFGKNPRVALAKTLEKAARKMRQRHGGYAGFGRK